MTLWRLELIRMFRTKRWIALVSVYLFFGFLGPVTAEYMSEILGQVGGGLEIVFPDPIPADGITQYVGNVSQIGLLVVVFVAAGALCFDAIPEMGTFFRTRVSSLGRIIAPRYTVSVAAAVGAWTLGTLAAWYETVVLLGPLPAGSLLIGWGLGALYLAFAVALVAAAAARAKSVLATALSTILVLLALPIIGVVPNVGEWLPSHLVGALDGMVRGNSFSNYVPALLVTIVATCLALWASIVWGSRREI